MYLPMRQHERVCGCFSIRDGVLHEVVARDVDDFEFGKWGEVVDVLKYTL